MTAGLFIFVYYTAWCFYTVTPLHDPQPFHKEDTDIMKFFPIPFHFALEAPMALLAAFVVFVLGYIQHIDNKIAAKKAAKLRAERSQ